MSEPTQQSTHDYVAETPEKLTPIEVITILVLLLFVIIAGLTFLYVYFTHPAGAAVPHLTLIPPANLHP